MKHGKKPTVAQRKWLTSKGIIWENWLVVKDMPTSRRWKSAETDTAKRYATPDTDWGIKI